MTIHVLLFDLCCQAPTHLVKELRTFLCKQERRRGSGDMLNSIGMNQPYWCYFSMGMQKSNIWICVTTSSLRQVSGVSVVVSQALLAQSSWDGAPSQGTQMNRSTTFSHGGGGKGWARHNNSNRYPTIPTEIFSTIQPRFPNSAPSVGPIWGPLVRMITCTTPFLVNLDFQYPNIFGPFG